MNRSVALVVALFACATGGFAAGPGTSAADFLKIPVGARESSLGGASAAADGPESLVYNPAALSDMQLPEISYSYNNYLPGIAQHWLGGALPLGPGTFGAGVNYLSVDPFPSYDASDNRTGSVSAYDAAVSAGYAMPLGDRMSAGAAVKRITSRLDTESASCWAADAGLLFRAGERVTLSLAEENLYAGRLKYISEGFRPARKMKAGASYFVSGRDGDVTALLAMDLNFPEDGDNFVSAGLETSLYRTLALRAGYSSFGDISNGITFGLGLIMPAAFGAETRLDYSYGSTYDLGNTHRVSVSRRFGGEPRVRRAMKDAGNGKAKGRPEITFGGLLELLYGDHPGASLSAAEHMATMDDPRALQHFEAMLSSGKSEWRASGRRGLVLSTDPEAPGLLRAMLAGPSLRLRVQAAEILGERGGALSAAYLQDALKREDSESVKSAILGSLMRINSSGKGGEQ